MSFSLSSPLVFHSCPNPSQPSIFARFSVTNRNIPLRFNLRHSSPPLAALSPGRPPPQGSEPPNGKDTGPTSTTRLQDTSRIFFAVLFWMALFFWSCIWDGRNNDGGISTRPRKGSWFRK